MRRGRSLPRFDPPPLRSHGQQDGHRQQQRQRELESAGDQLRRRLFRALRQRHQRDADGERCRRIHVRRLERMQHGVRHDVRGDHECGEDGHRHRSTRRLAASHGPACQPAANTRACACPTGRRSARDGTSSDSTATADGLIPRCSSGQRPHHGDACHRRRRVRVRAAWRTARRSAGGWASPGSAATAASAPSRSFPSR